MSTAKCHPNLGVPEGSQSVVTPWQLDTNMQLGQTVQDVVSNPNVETDEVVPSPEMNLVVNVPNVPGPVNPVVPNVSKKIGA